MQLWFPMVTSVCKTIVEIKAMYESLFESTSIIIDLAELHTHLSVTLAKVYIYIYI